MWWVLLATLVASCTFTYVEGDNNHFNDLGGDVTSRLSRAAPHPASAPNASSHTP